MFEHYPVVFSIITILLVCATAYEREKLISCHEQFKKHGELIYNQEIRALERKINELKLEILSRETIESKLKQINKFVGYVTRSDLEGYVIDDFCGVLSCFNKLNNNSKFDLFLSQDFFKFTLKNSRNVEYCVEFVLQISFCYINVFCDDDEKVSIFSRGQCLYNKENVVSIFESWLQEVKLLM
jgi:hypothetical protein